MKPAAAGRFHPRFQVECLEGSAYRSSRRHYLRPRHFLTRVEVDDESIRPLDVFECRVPGVNFKHAHLDEADDAGDVIGDQIFADFPFLLYANAAERFGRPR